jgi:hypothetical protein
MFSYLYPYTYISSPYTPHDIWSAEKKAGARFPLSLSSFFLEIGAGYLPLKNESMNYDFSGIILPPWVIAEFMSGNLFPGMRTDQPEICFFAEEICESDPALENMPFFEVCDSAVFAFFKRISKEQSHKKEPSFSEEVWCLDEKICDSFEEFIFRMHSEGPESLFPFLQTCPPKIDMKKSPHCLLK